LKKILVTGGAGFIGSHIVDELVRKGHNVTIFDSIVEQVHPNRQIPSYLSKDANFVKGDVRDYDALRKVVLCQDVIFHLAALVGVAQSQYEIKQYVNVNVGGTANLLDILVNNDNHVEKVLTITSMTSYGEGMYECDQCGDVHPSVRTLAQIDSSDWRLSCPHCQGKISPIPTNETVRQNCNSIYAITKKTQEEIVLNICMTYGIPSAILKCFNVYGLRQSLSNPYTGVAAIFLNLLNNNQPPVVYEDGLQTRDFVSVHDVVRACMLAMAKDEANYHVFNIASGTSITINEVAILLAKMLCKEIKPTITGKFRKGDIRHCFADIGKVKKTLGFIPQISLESGFKELVEWSAGEETENKFMTAATKLKEMGLVE